MAQPQYFQSDDPLDQPLPKPRSTPWVLYVLLGVAVIGLAVVALRAGRQRPSGANHPAVGKSIDRLQLEPLTGDAPTISLDSLQGKVSVLNFWGTWCPPCQEEFPHIVSLWKKHQGNEQFQLAAVSCKPGVEKDIDELRETTTAYLKNAKTNMPTYYDPQAVSRIAIMNTSGQFAFPTTIVFDREGKIRGYWQGYMPGTEEDIESLVKQLLTAK